jgi:hypothetical protein
MTRQLTCRLLTRGEQRRLRLNTVRQASRMGVITRPIELRGWVARHRSPRHHPYAINRAWRYAQLTSGTNVGYHRMCLPPGTNDRIDGAGRQAFDAPNAPIFVDDGNQRWAFNTIGRIERQRVPTQQASECSDRRTPARRALIDLCETGRDRRRVRATPVVATACALCLRKDGVDVVGECHCVTSGNAPRSAAPRPRLVALRCRWRDGSLATATT